MSVQTERDRLQILQAAAPGVTHAYRYVPRQIEDGLLPAFITFAGRGAYALRGKQNLRVTRLYRMQLYVMRFTSGSENYAEKTCEGLIEDVQDYFIGRPRLEYNDSGLETVLSTRFTEDAGILSGRYPLNNESAPYYALIEYRLEIESIRVIPHQIGG